MFVKGPFDDRSKITFSRKSARTQVFLDDMKPLLGDLNPIGVEIVPLIPGNA